MRRRSMAKVALLSVTLALGAYRPAAATANDISTACAAYVVDRAG